jgi:hypothetical protein
MPSLLGSAMLWFAGFALLVPVAPLWVIRGGGDDLGAGLVTGVMMACTVLAQLSMRRVLADLGWRWTQGFAVAGEPARDSVSIAWNLSFDAGTGLGAFAVGAIATATSYSVAFAVLALAAGSVGGWWAVRA